MPYDNRLLRFERFQGELGYHAAYNYWNLRGVLAERWAHGPIFGAASSTDPNAQTALSPASGEGDSRLWAVYGLRALGLNAEGQEWVPKAAGLLDRWARDALDVLQPKRVIRAAVNLFALYPVDDIKEVSSKLRAVHQNPELMPDLLPDSLREYRDEFHSAIDFFVPLDDTGSAVSVVVGAVGPYHHVFSQPDEERDDQWWMGVKYERRRLDDEGLKDPLAVLTKMSRRSKADVEYIAEHALEGVV